MLDKFRRMDCIKILSFMSEYQKEDSTFTPVKDNNTSRWHINANGRDYELLITGAKWFDTINQKGGGGAIDLAMHLLNLDFVNAVKLLKRKIK